MSHYNQNQPPVGVPPPQGYPPEGYPKDAYPPQGYPPPYGQPPPQRQQSSKAGKKTRKMDCLIQKSNTNATYGHSATVMKKGGLRRKPLSDISNRNQTSKKEPNRKLTSKKQSKKLSAVTEDLFHEEDIADEIAYKLDVHNHDECIKAKHEEMAMKRDDFLKYMFFPCPKELPSVKRPESPPRSPQLLLEEIPEVPILGRAPDHSPPESPDDFQYWEDDHQSWKDDHQSWKDDHQYWEDDHQYWEDIKMASLSS